jgi:hypothetical protein
MPGGTRIFQRVLQNLLGCCSVGGKFGWTDERRFAAILPARFDGCSIV